jgi:lipoprotein-anchoring transpeptidase ErfK/SrfK
MRILTRLAAGTTAVVAVTAALLAATPAQAVAPAVAQSPTAVVAKDPNAMTPIYPRIVPGKLRIDRRCMTGRALCVNKTTRKVHLMLNGKVLRSADARFGCSGTATRNGQFKVYRKSRYHVSRQYNSPMPWAMFFSGGQAVHYSSDFAARGYNGCSHGCVNVRSKSAIDYIYRRTPVGTKVIVYRS